MVTMPMYFLLCIIAPNSHSCMGYTTTLGGLGHRYMGKPCRPASQPDSLMCDNWKVWGIAIARELCWHVSFVFYCYERRILRPEVCFFGMMCVMPKNCLKVFAIVWL